MHLFTRVSDDEEKNIILLRLLEYLGHPNPYICAVAYNEVRSEQCISLHLSFMISYMSANILTPPNSFINLHSNFH